MPDIQEKIHKEIKEKIGDRFPQVSDKVSTQNKVHILQSQQKLITGLQIKIDLYRVTMVVAHLGWVDLD